ncbi:MAG: hypothetical protein ACJAZF_000634 [Granulosicoccus sp.]|jgi:hypothetical protein
MSQPDDSAILSRPRYGVLTPVEANYHLFVADDSGGDAIIAFAQLVPDNFFDNAEIIYVVSDPAKQVNTLESLAALKSPRLYTGPTLEAALPRMSASLDRMRMGTQVYISGSESLLGLATMTAMEAGLDYQALQTEHRGSLARRVQCVHCKGITSDVTTQPAECKHCGLLLLVRDHYSRRFAAFQGVNINAEDPTDIPEKEETFS